MGVGCRVYTCWKLEWSLTFHRKWMSSKSIKICSIMCPRNNCEPNAARPKLWSNELKKFSVQLHGTLFAAIMNDLRCAHRALIRVLWSICLSPCSPFVNAARIEKERLPVNRPRNHAQVQAQRKLKLNFDGTEHIHKHLQIVWRKKLGFRTHLLSLG